MPDAATLRALENAVDANWDKQVGWLQQLVRFPEPARQGRPVSGLDRPRVPGTRMERGSLHARSGRRWSICPATRRSWTPTIARRCRSSPPSARRRRDASAGRSLILQGHVDVVPEGPADMWTHPAVRSGDPGRLDERPRRARHEAGRVGDGVRDGRAARAPSLAPAADVYVQTVTEEECTGNGALSTLARGYRAEAA